MKTKFNCHSEIFKNCAFIFFFGAIIYSKSAHVKKCQVGTVGGIHFIKNTSLFVLYF